tara:strand:- start:7813 stop:8436 length:624 start_codon:yes stop_codon:yes gene_type:complete
MVALVTTKNIIIQKSFVNKKLDNLFMQNPIKGKYANLFHLERSDMRFVYHLRKSRATYLGATDEDINKQFEYFDSYSKRFNNQEEIYFKIVDPLIGKLVGVTRLTQLKQDEFNFESGVVESDSSPNCYLDTMFICYRIGFEYLEKTTSGIWKVDKNNKRMLKLHELVGIGEIIDGDSRFVYLRGTQIRFYENFEKYRQLGFGEFNAF